MSHICGHRLRSRRITQSRSLRQVARTSIVDFRRLSEVERGFSTPEQRRLAETLGCDVVDLRCFCSSEVEVGRDRSEMVALGRATLTAIQETKALEPARQAPPTAGSRRRLARPAARSRVERSEAERQAKNDADPAGPRTGGA